MMTGYSGGLPHFGGKSKSKKKSTDETRSTLSLPSELKTTFIDKFKMSRGVTLTQDNKIVSKGEIPKLSPLRRGIPTPHTIERYR